MKCVDAQGVQVTDSASVALNVLVGAQPPSTFALQPVVPTLAPFAASEPRMQSPAGWAWSEPSRKT